MKSRRSLLVLIGAALFSALVILTFPDSATFLLPDGTKVHIRSGAFASVRASIYRVTVRLPHGPETALDLRGDLDHAPILALYPADDGAFYLLYDCDVILRLIKIDTRHDFQRFHPTSALNWIVRSSKLKVEQAGEADWKACLRSVEGMTAKEFERHSFPVGIGLLRIHPKRNLLLPRFRDQVDAMFGGRSITYDPEK